ncbi:hypothetical protein AC579_3865 [Pseudocercospora musae]|uniref:Uncharacterized protein n=1 Tax=Pseudocercospora musae TaxID=113226 RepID=A0A139IS26_9PEZI|nr:hypothetical protein AC579_3865 [Pseudocercospora musae]
MEKCGKMPARLAISSRKQVSRYHDYDPSTDTEPGTPEHETLLQSRASRILNLWKICVLFISLLLGLLLGFLSCDNIQNLPPRRDCGTSIPQAISKGCAFDMLSNAWIPTRCFERDTEREFRDWVWSHQRLKRPFPYFSDSAGKEWISHEEILGRHSGQVWTTEEVGLGWCVFLGKRAGRSLAQKRKTMVVDGMKEVMEQCSRVYLGDLTRNSSMGRDLGILNRKIQVGFGKC